MKNFFLFCLIYLGFSQISQAQVKLDSIRNNNQSSLAFDLKSIRDTLYFPLNTYTLSGFKSNLMVMDEDLNILDSLPLPSTLPDSSQITNLFEFRGQHRILIKTEPKNNHISYEIKHNQLIDSALLKIDTIQNPGPYRFYSIDSNTLRVVVSKWDQSYRFVLNSVVIDLDSNFTIKDYYSIPFDQPAQNPNRVITSVVTLNDTICHIHTPDGLYIYNLKQRAVLNSRNLIGHTHASYPLNNKEYLASGTAAKYTEPWHSTIIDDFTGFYRISNSGLITDTVTFFTKVDSSQFPNYLNYSYENVDVPNIVVYDSTNIFIAGASSFRVGPGQQLNYLNIIKTDSRGNEKWRYVHAMNNRLCNLTGIQPTSDFGCILIGSFAYYSTNTATILIKLGPDGTISNVELDAQETVVNFYPNPVNDKLYYNYLPKASGNYTLEIIDMQGKPVQDVVLENEKGYLPVSLQSGFYLYHLKSENGKVEQVGRLVIE